MARPPIGALAPAAFASQMRAAAPPRAHGAALPLLLLRHAGRAAPALGSKLRHAAAAQPGMELGADLRRMEQRIHGMRHVAASAAERVGDR